MSSPNEPGYPGPGESPGNGNGSVERAPGRVTWPGGTSGGGRPADSGPAANSGEVPPWQRGTNRTPPPPARTAEPPARSDSRPPGHSPGAEAEVRQFIFGTAAPGAAKPAPQAPAEAEPAPGRTDVARTKAYASELPDLSGPTRGSQPRRTGADRPDTPTAAAGTNKTSGAGRVQVSGRSRSGPVRASMQIRRIDPWSALKVSLLLSVALFFVWMIAVAFLYLVLGGMGVWSKLNSNVGDLLTSTSGSGGELVSSGTIFGGATLIGLVNIVLLTAMATIGAFIYNLTTDLVGGVEVTLADRD